MDGKEIVNFGDVSNGLISYEIRHRVKKKTPSLYLLEVDRWKGIFLVRKVTFSA